MADLQIVPACKNVEAQFVEMKVPLYSFGCERKIKKALSHLRGIYSINVDYPQQKVTVWGICNKNDVLWTIKKKRKEARFWDVIEDNTMEDHEDKVETQPPSPRFRHYPTSLTKAKSFSLKALKKVFNRSHSF